MLKVPAFVALLALAGLSGCVSSHVIVGKVRPSISPDQVQLYLRPPAGKYEEVALLDSNSRHSFSFTAQGKTNADITTILGNSESTVKKHVLEIFEQLGIETHGAAALRALEVLSSPTAHVKPVTQVAQ